jgi:hypothetical protein
MKTSLYSLIPFLPFLLNHFRLPSQDTQSQSHIATKFYDQIFITVWELRSCFLSDERTGLSFVYAAGSCQRSLSRVRVPWYSRPYFTVSDLRLPFRRLLRLAGSRWSYSTPPSHGFSRHSLNSSRYIASGGRTENTVIQQYLNCCLFIRCRGNVFPETLPSNERLLWLHYSGFRGSCHNMQSLAICVFPQDSPDDVLSGPNRVVNW